MYLNDISGLRANGISPFLHRNSNSIVQASNVAAVVSLTCCERTNVVKLASPSVPHSVVVLSASFQQKSSGSPVDMIIPSWGISCVPVSLLYPI